MTTVTIDRRRPSFGLQHRLVLARDVAGMDQTAIGVALGISRQTVSNYERGMTKPKKAIVSAWALATGVDAEWLLTGTESAPAPAGPDGGVSSHLRESNPRPIHYMRKAHEQREWAAA